MQHPTFLEGTFSKDDAVFERSLSRSVNLSNCIFMERSSFENGEIPENAFEHLVCENFEILSPNCYSIRPYGFSNAVITSFKAPNIEQADSLAFAQASIGSFSADSLQQIKREMFRGQQIRTIESKAATRICSNSFSISEVVTARFENAEVVNGIASIGVAI